MDQFLEQSSDLCIIGDILRYYVRCADKSGRNVFHSLFIADKRSGHFFQRAFHYILRINGISERFESFFLRYSSPCPPFLLIWSVYVFQFSQCFGSGDRFHELFRHLALLFYGTRYLITALIQIPQICHSFRDLSYELIIHRSMHLFAVTGDKRNRITFIEEFHDVLHMN